jgi:hypothetical protein
VQKSLHPIFFPNRGPAAVPSSACSVALMIVRRARTNGQERETREVRWFHRKTLSQKAGPLLAARGRRGKRIPWPGIGGRQRTK